jgi:undecaprenyl-phosphate 4-deoxy-4-formamido-L-arabinose transferase
LYGGPGFESEVGRPRVPRRAARVTAFRPVRPEWYNRPRSTDPTKKCTTESSSTRGPAADLLPGVSVVVRASTARTRWAASPAGEVLPRCAARYEVILVNDHSQDRTWSVIGELARRYPWVRGIDLMRNYGQQSATLCGTRAARHEATVTMDDDLQHPPAEVPRLLQKLESGTTWSTARRGACAIRCSATDLVARHAVSLAAAAHGAGHHRLRAFARLRDAFWEHRGRDRVRRAVAVGTTQIVPRRSRCARAAGRRVTRPRSLHSALHMDRLHHRPRCAWRAGSASPSCFGAGLLAYLLRLYFTEDRSGFVFLADDRDLRRRAAVRPHHRRPWRGSSSAAWTGRPTW